VLDAWFAAQTNLRTWQASFTQTRSLKTFKQPLVTSGRVWVKPPNRYRWELGTPAQTIALRQADELLVIYPGLKRVERYPAGDKASGPWGDALALIEAGFPRDRAELESRLRILSLTEARGVWTFALQPRSAAARRMMPEIRLGLAASDFSLVNTELVLTDGSTLRNDFTNAVLNSALDAALFDWTPPADFTISEPLRK
jgi:outer membrane lipoprotein-sorting protein